MFPTKWLTSLFDLFKSTLQNDFYRNTTIGIKLRILETRHYKVKHSNDLFSETTTPMVLNFLMQHGQTAGLQKGKIKPGWQLIGVVVVLLFYVRGKHLKSCRDGQLT